MTVTIPASYYQQFDADYALDVPAESCGGWQRAELPLSIEHTAVVVMHAWDQGTAEAFPGWHRAVEYAFRAGPILQHVFPPLLAAVRASDLKLYHVVGGKDYYSHLPGYQRAMALAEQIDFPAPPLPGAEWDDTRRALGEFRAKNVFVGEHNVADTNRGFDRLDFAPQARPVGDEGIAENGDQLFALCQADGVNHLIYCGFAINWCLLCSPGGMIDMGRRGVLSSALRQAVTAVENKETARTELSKELALWRVSVEFGFVYDVDDFQTAIARDAAGRGG